MAINIEVLKKLRETTGVSFVRVREVIDEVGGDENKAFEILKKEGAEKTEKRDGRETSQGLVETYVHHSGKVASMIELLCETDFVSRNELFKELAHNLALQVASTGAKDAEELLKQDYIKDGSKTVDALVKEVKAKTGENIKVGRVVRMELGKE